jgi:site-specific recombinase XerD
MSILLFSDSKPWQRLHVGPLSPYIDPFAQYLLQQGYATWTIVDKLRVVTKLSQWLERHQLGVGALDEQQVSAFINQLHQSELRTYHGDHTTLRMFLEHMRNCGILTVPAPKVEDNALAMLERDFVQYLREQRGLSAATLHNYLPFARCFLSECFGQGAVELKQLSTADVTEFVLRHAPNLGTACAKLMITALRSFFRFLHQRGELDMDLANAMPTVAHWRLSTLPKYLEPEQVEQLLQSCDQSTTIGQRDHTVLLLLARLGLRAGEVVQLSLDDIDWHAGLLTVRGKGSQVNQLPLRMDVGKALATYLRHGRPACITRRVFVRSRAPYVGFASSVAIDSIVSRALKRAGLTPLHQGAHLLRHSLATRMLHQEASLVEIGQVLRHRLLQTTEIYAKIDQATLGALTQPWPPGGAI